tara:strand:+ start:1132 stop:2499 length:1368 start_codon:yes stop_codon:yes gene_type:complete
MLYAMRFFIRKIIFGVPVLLVLLVLVEPAKANEVNKSAIALLIAKNETGKTVGTGSGFVIKPEGTLVTNYHVLVNAYSVKAYFPNGDQVDVKGIYKIDRTRDFAILKLSEGLYSTLELGDSSSLQTYDYTSALGYLSENVKESTKKAEGIITQTYGFVLGIHPQAFADIPFIYTTTKFGPGFSGGPLLDQDNKVIGIATIESRSINLAIPIQTIKSSLKKNKTLSFKELLQQEKNSKEAMYYRGNFYLYGLGDPNKAIEEYEKILAQDESFILAHYDLAAAYRNLGMEKKAIQEYEKTIELQPNFPEGLSNLGGHYFRSGKIEQAKDFFKRAVKAFPNFIQALSNLGAVLNKLGQPEEAIPHLKKTLALNPEFGIAHFNLGNSQFALNRLEEAKISYERAIEIGLDFLSIHWKLYEIHLKNKTLKKAEKELKTILEIDPLNEEAQKKLSALPATQ